MELCHIAAKEPAIIPGTPNPVIRNPIKAVPKAIKPTGKQNGSLYIKNNLFTTRDNQIFLKFYS